MQIRYCPDCGKKEGQYKDYKNFSGVFLKRFQCNHCSYEWYEYPSHKEIEEFYG